MLIEEVYDWSKQPYDHNKLDKDYLFEGKQTKHYAVVFIRSFSQIINHLLQHVVLFFKQVLNLNKTILFISPGGIMIPIIFLICVQGKYRLNFYKNEVINLKL